jgi:hypothetical protein
MKTVFAVEGRAEKTLGVSPSSLPLISVCVNLCRLGGLRGQNRRFSSASASASAWA